ncbi:cysteine synthase A [Candidatus Bipolaricaulota bacterium]|nr:cysteine synthase A [Candidatus Bipolaricaulota bacterium]
MNIANSVLDLIGRTPLVRLRDTDTGLAEAIYAKLEKTNPMGSVKDRIALAMIEDAERRGVLSADTVVIEPTSGNTGIALAMVCAVKGYRLILTMPDTMSVERRDMLMAFGTELVLTPGSEGMRGAIEEADRIAARKKNAFVPGQFDNPANPRIHEETTAREIWEDTDGLVDIVVAGIGTGGTVTGIARFLKQEKADVKVVGVEPASSPFLTEGSAGKHKIQGIGAGFRPSILELERLDEVITVSDKDAAFWMRHLARAEGIFSGISSGAALAATVEIAKRPELENATIVVILPDGGEKYLSSDLWEKEDPSVASP